MSDRNMRWGEVVEVSADKGPYKLCTIECDGKRMPAFVGEVFGVQSVPHKGAQVLVAFADGDEGKGVIIASMPRPKDRVDGQKEGEVALKNFDAGQFFKMDKDGNVVLQAPGTVTIKADKIVLDGPSHIGGDGGVPASKQGTVDTAGAADVSNLATKVFLT